MDGKSVWVGFDYAHTFEISRGVEYYDLANRVTAIAVYDKQLGGNSRKTTFVRVQFRDTETGEPIDKYGYRPDGTRGLVDEVRARDLFMRWDEYEDETAHRNKERIEREAQLSAKRLEREAAWAAQRAERERIEQEERERLRLERLERERIVTEERQRVLSALAIKGISTAGVLVGIDSVTIPKDVIKRWLGVSE